MGAYIDVKAARGGSFKAYVATPQSGSGPGLVMLQEIFGVNAYMRSMADLYAEEGYVAIVADLFWRLEPGVDLDYGDADFAKAFELYGKFDSDTAIDDVKATLRALRALPSHAGKVGAIGYCLGGLLAMKVAARTDVDCAVSYYGVGLEGLVGEVDNITCPMVFHFAELDKFAPEAARNAVISAFAGRPEIELYTYPGVDHAFATSGRDVYHKPSASMAYSRSLALFRRVMGPTFDLSKLWDDHCYFEFGTRDVPATMATMVSSPYVNHIPTMTGGVGAPQLSRFYKWHFVDANPEDTKLVPISRTIGTDRLVDEMLFCFTHTREIDWMLPGIAPTGKYVEVPLIAIVNFRGAKLCHEHIYWDQASVLVQIGVLSPDGLPVAGIETAKKLVDETLPSNSLMGAWATSRGKAV